VNIRRAYGSDNITPQKWKFLPRRSGIVLASITNIGRMSNEESTDSSK